MRTAAQPIGTSPPGAGWSQALRVGEELIVSGLHARAEDGSVPAGAGAQMDAALDKLESLLADAGGRRDNVLKLTVYLTDIADKEAVNAVRNRRFGPVYPCSTLIGVSAFAFPELKVEVDATARLDVALNG